LDLNKEFNSNKDILNIFMKLEQYRKDKKNPFTDDDKHRMTLYLTFFELIYILINRKLISFEVINDLFVYRFFSAVHNKHVQEIELVKDAECYKNIFKLHYEWVNHRRGLHEKIMDEESSLDKICSNYYDLIK
jgi:hypothetical protein